MGQKGIIMARQKRIISAVPVSGATCRATRNMLPDEMGCLIERLGTSENDFITMLKGAKRDAHQLREEKGIGPNEVLADFLLNTIGIMVVPKDVFKRASLSPEREAIRSMVVTYYQLQKQRVAMGNQVSALAREGKDNLLHSFFAESIHSAEENVKTYLDVWTDSDPVGAWAKAQCGIGPVLAAGVVAYFDVTKTHTAGGFWRYVGWDGEEVPRKRGEKLGYNPEAKKLCWKIGDSFVKQSNRPQSLYGSLYREKKDWYIRKNTDGGFAEKAARELSKRNYGEGTQARAAYSEGKLPDGHIDAMARRFASKMFLSHLFDVMWIMEHGELPRIPYVHEKEGHVTITKPHHMEIIWAAAAQKFPDRDWDALAAEYMRR